MLIDACRKMSFNVGDFTFRKLFMELNWHTNCGIPFSIFLSITGDCLATWHHIPEDKSHSQSLALVLVVLQFLNVTKSANHLMLMKFRCKINNLNFKVLYIFMKQIIFKNEGYDLSFRELLQVLEFGL
jgi:hypothetical protein